MKGNRLKIFGFALLGGLALLFAGCGQQAGTGGGQELPKPIQISLTGVTPNQVITGVRNVNVSINEDAQAQEVSLYVDDQLIGKYTIAAQGLRPQALGYNFTINTWACDAAYLASNVGTGCSVNDNTPLFTNGTHTVKAVVKNALETKSLSVPVNLQNPDWVILNLTGKNAKDAHNYTWYGGDDLTLEAVPVSYSGRPISSVLLSVDRQDIPNTTIVASPNAPTLDATEKPVSGNKATFVIAKANNANTGVEGGVYFEAQVRYGDDGTLSSVAGYHYYALDFDGPSFGGYKVKLNGVYEDGVNTLLATTGGWLNGQSPLYVDATDAGVGGVTYQLQVLQGSTVKATLNPNDTLASVPEANTGTYTLKVVNLADALGNITSVPSTSPFGLDKTKPTITTTFAANGKVLNGTLAPALKVIQGQARDGTGSVYSSVGGNYAGAAPDASGPGASGWSVQITKGSCTFTLTSNGGGGSGVGNAVGNSQVSYAVDLEGSNASGPTGCTWSAPTTASGDGDYTVTIRLVDRARNVSDPIAVSFYWMTQKPVVQFLQSPSGAFNLGGSSFVQVNGAAKVTHPAGKPLLKAILYATGAANAGDVQLVASPNVNIGNTSALAFGSDGSVSGNYYDFTANAANFPFTLQFNATGNYDVVLAAVPEAYDNTGTLNVSNLNNSTSASVTVNP